MVFRKKGEGGTNWLFGGCWSQCSTALLSKFDLFVNGWSLAIASYNEIIQTSCISESGTLISLKKFENRSSLIHEY